MEHILTYRYAPTPTDFLERSRNLSDLSNVPTARANLGLGPFATKGFPAASPLLGSDGTNFILDGIDPKTLVIAARVLKVIGSGAAGPLLRWDGTEFVNVGLGPGLSIVNNVLYVSGLAVSNSLREDGGTELREDGGKDIEEW